MYYFISPNRPSLPRRQLRHKHPRVKLHVPGFYLAPGIKFIRENKRHRHPVPRRWVTLHRAGVCAAEDAAPADHVALREHLHDFVFHIGEARFLPLDQTLEYVDRTGSG